MPNASPGHPWPRGESKRRRPCRRTNAHPQPVAPAFSGSWREPTLLGAISIARQLLGPGRKFARNGRDVSSLITRYANVRNKTHATPQVEVDKTSHARRLERDRTGNFSGVRAGAARRRCARSLRDDPLRPLTLRRPQISGPSNASRARATRQGHMRTRLSDQPFREINQVSSRLRVYNVHGCDLLTHLRRDRRGRRRTSKP